MTNQNLYVDVNVLQTVPSSNINRDDTGAPKTALYGGVTRARVSSQSWKHAVREAFRDDNVSVGTRTKDAAKLLADKLQALDVTMTPEAAEAKVDEIFKAASIKLNKERETGALLLISQGQITKLAQYALDNSELDKKEVKKVLKGDQSLDLALFGRMVADNPELNVDASAQVAHAVSTHEVVPEYDYFTALDDEQPDDTTGAAMLGTINFNSATLYRYANVNVNELSHNLNATDAIHGTTDFIRDFLLAMPTGKQNTFANKTLPSYVMVTIRPDTPVNLVSAFEKPVSSNKGYVQPSIERLEGEYAVTQQFVEKPLLNVVLGKADSQVGEQAANLSELLEKVTAALSEAVQDENTDD
ncbi:MULTISPECIES: type I-E CRISPR-associated protein Cas7/Cse4/CasC [Lactobacillaceae]|uniref:type I-E CRISPR-associated protein Cas7/Cse4/CasC n=1 Tax=Lactobacillaceae TaxID=33958 RepID=UPI001456B724|nr:type I-E CRISPR-associated protein Cas7/Cse4/CasC [Lactobacillus sp. HBUAS51381]NLR10597.1 type I-E CRISPR-associated protein Cas7/Cse4/CasC [Lactobacillus sp. HBUAS51381]